MSGTGKSKVAMTSESGPYYVYLLSTPDGIPCYVGKGKGRRIDDHERYRTHNSDLRIIIEALRAEGLVLQKTKLYEGLSEQRAFDLESKEIFRIGRRQFGIGPLVNRDDGGVTAGSRKLVVSAETRAKLRAAKLGRKLSPEHRAKIGAKSRGRGHTAESREKIAAANRGKKKTWRPGSYERWLDLQRKNNPGYSGHRHTDESRNKIKVARARQIVKGTFKPGHVLSDEARANLSAGLKAYWVKRRAAQSERAAV